MSSEAWELTKEWRRIIVMDLLELVIPKAKGHAMPKRTIFDRAVKEYKRHEDKFKEQYPFLHNHKDFFINAAPLAGLSPAEDRSQEHVYRLGRLPRILLPYGQRLEPRFGRLGRDYNRIVFDKEMFIVDPSGSF